MSLEPRIGTWNLNWNGKMFFPYTHASKTQEFNFKMNVVPINLETNMGMHNNTSWVLQPVN